MLDFPRFVLFRVFLLLGLILGLQNAAASSCPESLTVPLTIIDHVRFRFELREDGVRLNGDLNLRAHKYLSRQLGREVEVVVYRDELPGPIFSRFAGLGALRLVARYRGVLADLPQRSLDGNEWTYGFMVHADGPVRADLARAGDGVEFRPRGNGDVDVVVWPWREPKGESTALLRADLMFKFAPGETVSAPKIK